MSVWSPVSGSKRKLGYAELPDQYEAYENLVENVDPLTIADAPRQGPAWLLSLDNRWTRCTVRHLGGSLWISDATDGILAGMSGSPLLADDGSAIGVVCTSAGTSGLDQPHTKGGPNPRLMGNLPGWCIRSLASK
jgi:hypothetical protein